MSLYVTVKVTLEDIHGDEADYEVGAWVDEEYLHDGRDRWVGYSVGEPDISAAGSTLEESRLYPDPQGGESLADGWSGVVEAALAEAAEEQYVYLHERNRER